MEIIFYIPWTSTEFLFTVIVGTDLFFGTRVLRRAILIIRDLHMVRVELESFVKTSLVENWILYKMVLFPKRYVGPLIDKKNPKWFCYLYGEGWS